MGYRLLEKFGTRRVLFEEESCQGWRFLKQSKVTQILHQSIATSYRGEREDAESSRFVDEMRTLMQEHRLPYSILNLEKAKVWYCKARADVLHNTDDRYLINYSDEQIDPIPVHSEPTASVVDVECAPDIISQPQPIVTNAAPVLAPEMMALSRVGSAGETIHEAVRPTDRQQPWELERRDRKGRQDHCSYFLRHSG